MGMFSFIEKGLGIRTGATAAARDAEEAGQVIYDKQDNLLNEITGYYNPTIQQGQQAGSMLSDFYAGNQQPVLDAVSSSPFLSQNIALGENAIARNQQATGGFRSGTTQENLALNSQNQFQNLTNQYLSGLGQSQEYGANALNNYSNVSNNIINGLGTTSGEIANIGINQAANQSSLVGNVANAAGSVFTGLGGIAGITGLFSDRRLKTDIVKVDEKNGLPWYSWSWNEEAENLGLSGSDQGHIADEVEVVRPDLIGEKQGYKTVNYEGF